MCHDRYPRKLLEPLQIKYFFLVFEDLLKFWRYHQLEVSPSLFVLINHCKFHRILIHPLHNNFLVGNYGNQELLTAWKIIFLYQVNPIFLMLVEPLYLHKRGQFLDQLFQSLSPPIFFLLQYLMLHEKEE